MNRVSMQETDAGLKSSPSPCSFASRNAAIYTTKMRRGKISWGTVSQCEKSTHADYRLLELLWADRPPGLELAKQSTRRPARWTGWQYREAGIAELDR